MVDTEEPDVRVVRTSPRQRMVHLWPPVAVDSTDEEKSAPRFLVPSLAIGFVATLNPFDHPFRSHGK
jgi:hypothetical protein